MDAADDKVTEIAQAICVLTYGDMLVLAKGLRAAVDKSYGGSNDESFAADVYKWADNVINDGPDT